LSNLDKKEKKFWYHYYGNNGDASIMPGSSQFEDIIKNICLLREAGDFCFFPLWEDAMSGNYVADRSEYLSLLHTISIGLIIHDLQEKCNTQELALIHLVRILDETDRALSRLSEKIEDYYIALNPTELAGYERNVRGIIDKMGKSIDHPLYPLAKNFGCLYDSRAAIAKSVREYAERELPNMSALSGPVVAARLLALAGSKQRLAMMPSSSLQVFGAGPSLFMHLNSGTNPPKHGIIFQNKSIHNAKRRVRGRVSRSLACQLAIAAKIDFYRGLKDEKFIRRAMDRICRVGK